MPDIYDDIHHEFILALRAGHEVEIAATLAHYTRRGNRRYHLEKALASADRVTTAAAALRAEIERLEAAAEGAA